MCSLHLMFVVGALVQKALSCASGFLAGGLLLQSSRGLASEPGKEALVAEPQEDDSSGCCLLSAVPERRIGDEQSPCQRGVGDVQPSNPREEDGCRRAREEGVELRERPPGGHERRTRPPPPDCQWPPSNPCMCGPHEREPHEEGGPSRAALVAAIRQPLSLRGWLVEAILRREAVNQRWPGGCSFCCSRTTTRGHVGEAATI